ncbi:MAG: hypothetical protein WC827_04240 [Candidatus Paceibacterota bacterium]|jgi:hypothetical protein
MSQLLIDIIGGLAVVIIAAWFGLGVSTKITIQGGHKVKRTGKWIIIISVIMFFVGISLCKKGDSTLWGYDMSNPSTVCGVTIMLYSVLFFFVGKTITWFQGS